MERPAVCTARGREALDRRSRLALAVVCALATLLCLRPVHATAQSTTCRSDPMVWLSTGQQLRLTATLTDTLSDVQSIRFVLHIPPSVRVTAVTYTGGPVSHLERFVVIPNSARGIYDEYTTVMTGTSGLTVTVGASLTSTEIHQNLSAQATGVVDTPIHTRLVS